ncbi:MFS transporter [Arachnia propionica]|uniref:MFS transporter n=1 Tax=Arachnia propionica TaxID=1750 RepID=UPI00163AC0B4|nr:MFS transporter [Arachnia propionica]
MPRSLWQDRNFLTFWSGQALNQFASQVTPVAMSTLAILTLGANEAQVGQLRAASVLAFLLIGLPAGAWIDGMRKRRVMIVADGVGALLLGLVPVLFFLGRLELLHLYVISFLLGVGSVFFDVSYQSYVPGLVGPARIPEANAKLETSQQLSRIAGPAVAGWLVALLAAPVALLATIGGILGSLVALSRTRDDERPRPRRERPSVRAAIREGLVWVFGDERLRRIVATSCLFNFGQTMVGTLVAVLILRNLGAGPQMMGLLFGLGGLGGLVGAVTSRQLSLRLGEGRMIVVGVSGAALLLTLQPLAAVTGGRGALVLLAVQSFLGSVFMLQYNIAQVSYRQRITPTDLLGRTNASVRFVVWGIVPLAALVGGGLAGWVGIAPTMAIGVLCCLVGVLPVATGPFWGSGKPLSGSASP